MDVALSEEEVIPQLWNAYKKKKEYLSGQKGAIPPHHALVEAQEKMGLREIVQRVSKETKAGHMMLIDRTVGNWLSEWRSMHKLLFRRILKDCGDWRKKDVRFGNPGDEVLYRIPAWPDVPREMNMLAHSMNEYLKPIPSGLAEQCKALAKVHYQFVRIHPFFDGNGRIARVLTDQVAVYYGLPPAVAGFPRHNQKKREEYHRAIRDCVSDSHCQHLALWIQSYIEPRLTELA